VDLDAPASGTRGFRPLHPVLVKEFSSSVTGIFYSIESQVSYPLLYVQAFSAFGGYYAFG